jgi:hypothetical protein
MPVIVDEVVISVEVASAGAEGDGSAPPTAEDKYAIISECVERVLDILEQKAER